MVDEIDAYHALSPHRGHVRRLRVPARAADRDSGTSLTSGSVARTRATSTLPTTCCTSDRSTNTRGVDRLVPILNRLNDRVSGAVRLTVVGDGGLRTDMEQRAADSAIEDRVTFTGWLPNDDLPRVFAAHDCFVYPGRWDEPFGRVFLEALSRRGHRSSPAMSAASRRSSATAASPLTAPWTGSSPRCATCLTARNQRPARRRPGARWRPTGPRLSFRSSRSCTSA